VESTGCGLVRDYIQHLRGGAENRKNMKMSFRQVGAPAEIQTEKYSKTRQKPYCFSSSCMQACRQYGSCYTTFNIYIQSWKETYLASILSQERVTDILEDISVTCNFEIVSKTRELSNKHAVAIVHTKHNPRYACGFRSVSTTKSSSTPQQDQCPNTSDEIHEKKIPPLLLV
jgi:hypothetical protein